MIHKRAIITALVICVMVVISAFSVALIVSSEVRATVRTEQQNLTHLACRFAPNVLHEFCHPHKKPAT